MQLSLNTLYKATLTSLLIGSLAACGGEGDGGVIDGDGNIFTLGGVYFNSTDAQVMLVDTSSTTPILIHEDGKLGVITNADNTTATTLTSSTIENHTSGETGSTTSQESNASITVAISSEAATVDVASSSLNIDGAEFTRQSQGMDFSVSNVTREYESSITSSTYNLKTQDGVMSLAISESSSTEEGEEEAPAVVTCKLIGDITSKGYYSTAALSAVGADCGSAEYNANLFSFNDATGALIIDVIALAVDSDADLAIQF